MVTNSGHFYPGWTMFTCWFAKFVETDDNYNTMNPKPSKAPAADPAVQEILDLLRAGHTFDQLLGGDIKIQGTPLDGETLWKAQQHLFAMMLGSRPEAVLRQLNQQAGRSLNTSSPHKEDADVAFAHANSAYYLKVTLDGVKPKVWRSLVVPGHIRLDLLHDVIQIAMGWDDCHLHVFEINGKHYAERPEEDFEGDFEHHYRLDALIHEAPTAFRYEYDFGDGWWHTIAVEKIVPFEPNTTITPTCAGGKMACPPEDCGGPFRYGEFIESLADPKHPEHKENRTWARRDGVDFDPKRFDLAHVEAELRKHYRWSRHRYGAPVFGVGW
jgi:Plasmid pRiA4b ORF-3-like protein